MDENPRIADGQEAVFHYGEHQSGGKSSNFGNPRLLCILVCPVILIMVLLAVSVNSIWVSSLDRGLHKAEVADQSLLQAYNESSTATWLIWTLGCHLGHFFSLYKVFVYSSVLSTVLLFCFSAFRVFLFIAFLFFFLLLFFCFFASTLLCWFLLLCFFASLLFSCSIFSLLHVFLLLLRFSACFFVFFFFLFFISYMFCFRWLLFFYSSLLVVLLDYKSYYKCSYP